MRKIIVVQGAKRIKFNQVCISERLASMTYTSNMH